MVETFVNNDNYEFIPYSDKLFIMNKFDITYIISKFQNILRLESSLAINYWEKSNIHHSYAEIENDLKDYFRTTDSNIIEKRKSHLNEIVNRLIGEKFDPDRFRALAKKYNSLFECCTPFVNGRHVYVQEYQTIESGFYKKIDNLPRIPGLYQGSATFLDSNKFKEYHFVKDANNKDIFYIVHKDAIKLDLLQFTYDDYIKLLM